MLVQWQKDFEVGHAATDAEHREVVDLLNELYVSLGSDAAHDAVDRALAELAQLLASHMAPHQDAAPVIERVHRLRRDWRQQSTKPKHDELRALAHWWLDHLCSHRDFGPIRLR
ncbi:MAG TPA: hypothetical protein VK196_15550 [Magnetospirillum sp.]|nr:hypothetical protein [Magnetospirillum sp.]